MNEREALKLSREALRTVHYAMIDAGVLNRQEVLNKVLTAIAAIEEALAQSEQEPVAWELGAEVYWGDSPELSDYVRKEGTPLYTTPPQRTWVGLTDEEIAEIEDGYIVDYRIPAGCGWNFAKDIEAKLKEKNT